MTNRTGAVKSGVAQPVACTPTVNLAATRASRRSFIWRVKITSSPVNPYLKDTLTRFAIEFPTKIVDLFFREGAKAGVSIFIKFASPVKL